MKHLRLPIGDRERGWISYLTIDSNPKLQFSVCLSYYFCPLRGRETVSLWLRTLFVIWRLMWGETEGMKQRGGNPSMVPRRGFATEPTWRVQDHSFLITFLEIFVQPNFGQNFEWTRQIHGTANPGAQEATTLLTVFLLRFSLPSSCLNSAFRIDKNPQTHPWSILDCRSEIGRGDESVI